MPNELSKPTQLKLHELMNARLDSLKNLNPTPVFPYNDLMAHVGGSIMTTFAEPKQRLRAAASKVIQRMPHKTGEFLVHPVWDRARKRRVDKHIENTLLALIRAGIVARAKGSKPMASGGLKLVQQGGNEVWRTTDAHKDTNYLLEKLDPRHRFGMDLTTLFVHYENNTLHTTAFFDWVSGLTDPELCTILGFHPISDRHMLNNFKAGVTYMDDLRRQDFRLTFTKTAGRTLVQQAGHPFNTENYRAYDGTRGYGIFVMSPEGEFYATEAQEMVIHHSSFLSGAPVGAAGSIRVIRGRLELISGESGHYKPTRAQLRAAVKGLKDKGVPMTSFKVRLFERTPAAGIQEKDVAAFSFLFEPDLWDKEKYQVHG